MGLPGHRRTSSHKRRRAAHFALSLKKLNHCPQCGKPILPHHACAFCGYYRGRQVIVFKTKTSTEKQRKQERRRKEREKVKK